jgi:hypothetical protein
MAATVMLSALLKWSLVVVISLSMGRAEGTFCNCWSLDFATPTRVAHSPTAHRLARQALMLGEFDHTVGHELWRRLAKNDLKPWRKDMWCIPQVDGE